MLRAICTSQLHLPDLVCSRTVRILPAMMLSNSVQFSRTCQPTALRSSRSIVLHSSNRKGSIALKAALVETVGFDTVGRLTWDAAALPGADNAEILEGYTLRPNQVPAAAPTSTLPTRPDSLKRSSKPVVLIRDTNCWCPFCERVWLALEEKGIPYDCVLIELYNKPAWYKELVPTSLVPAVSFSEDGSIVWESKDILLDLERRFPQSVPLLPTDEEEQQAVMDFMGELEECGLDKHGYAYMTGGRMMGRNASEGQPPDMQALEKSFMDALSWFESNALARHGSGPYLLGESFSMLDIMTISSMERLAAGLPKFRGFDLRHNPAFPNTAAWFAAISARPAYQKVCSDDQTLQLLFQRMMGLTAGAAASASTSSAASAAAAAIAAFSKAGSAPTGEELSAEQVQKARTEAYDKLSSCAGDVVRHILAHSGVTRYQSSPYGSTTQSVNGHKPRIALPVREAVEQQVVRIMKALLLGSPGSKPNTSIAAAFGAVAATFLRTRWSECGKLSELSPAAIEQLQTACTQAVTQAYADGVDALVFVAPQHGEGATPEEAAAAQAAAEAAMKIQKNKRAIVEDILLKSGLARPGTSTYGSTYMSVNGNKPVISSAVASAVEVYALDRLCSMLMTGDAGPKPDEPEAAAVSAAALAFFRNRASAPRDMSAAATVQFRAACDAVLAQVY